MTSWRALLVLVASLAVTSCASGVQTAQRGDEARLRPRWVALDANGDGRVMLDELHPLQARAMRNNDADGNGEITLAEYVAYDLDPGGAARRPLPANVRLIADLPYSNTSDPRQRLDIYLPTQPSVQGPLPVIVEVHGGAWSMGSKLSGRSDTDLIVGGRYALVAVGYRLSWQETWPAQIYDAKAAIRWIRAHAAEYGFDPNRICIMGASAGGHIAAQVGLTNGDPAAEGRLGRHLDQSSSVQCVIDLFGPADLRTSPPMENGAPSPVVALLGGNAADRQELAASASPMLHVDANDPPFLIVHGTRDPLVRYQDSVDLSGALRAAGVRVDFQTVEGGGHGDFGAAGPEVRRRIAAFLERTFYDPNVSVATDTLRRD